MNPEDANNATAASVTQKTATEALAAIRAKGEALKETEKPATTGAATAVVDRKVEDTPYDGEKPTFDDADPFWYLQRDEESGLSEVTKDSVNEAIGVEGITFTPARSDNQFKAGIFGRVLLRTNVGTISNITIFGKKLPDGRWAVRVAEPARKRGEPAEGGRARYTADVRLNAVVRAQILTNIHYRIKENRDFEAAQAAAQTNQQ